MKRAASSIIRMEQFGTQNEEAVVSPGEKFVQQHLLRGKKKNKNKFPRF